MSECVLCRETVTNPLCPDCISEGIEQWLKESGLPSYAPTVTGVEGEQCIRCDKKIDVCLYCHTKQIYEWLKERKTSKLLLREFVDFFHFDLDKKGLLSDEGFV